MKKTYVILAISVLSLSAISAAQVKKGRKTFRSESSICQTIKGEPNITVCVDGQPGESGIGRERLDEVKLVASGLGKKLKRMKATNTARFSTEGYTNPGYPSSYPSGYTMPADPCYDTMGNYICGSTTPTTYYTYTPPTDPCYDTMGNYICSSLTPPTYYTYTPPTDPCYDGDGNYICGSITAPTYYTYTSPTDPCYDTMGNYICGSTTPPTYYTYAPPTDPCYDGDGNYICGGTNTYI